MDKYVCTCCGGAIDPATMECKYCGTKFKRDVDTRLVRIETYTNPVRTLKAKVTLNDELMRTCDPKDVSKLAMTELIDEFAECLAPYLQIDMMTDPRFNQTHICGTLKLVAPKESGITDCIDSIRTKLDMEGL